MGAGESLGFVPLDGWTIFFVILKTLIVVMIPGFLLSLALFPKKDDLDLSERFAMSFILGLAPIFTLTLLNIAFDFRVTFMTDLIMLLLFSVVGILGYLYRGGSIVIMGKQLLKPYRAG